MDMLPPKSARPGQKLGDMALQSPDDVDIRGGRVVRLRELRSLYGEFADLRAKLAQVERIIVSAGIQVPDGALPVSSLQFSATDRLAGRATAGAGPGEEITCTSAARSILDDASIAAIRATLGVPAYEVDPLWAPTITAQAGTFTTVSAAGWLVRVEDLVDFFARITITTVGTATGGVLIDLSPFTPADNFVGAGVHAAAPFTGLTVANAGGAKALVLNDNATSPIAAGAVLWCGGRFLRS